MSSLRIKAGKRVYEIIKDGGFNYDSISAYFGPAAGPRWLISSGFDLSLMQQRCLGAHASCPSNRFFCRCLAICRLASAGRLRLL